MSKSKVIMVNDRPVTYEKEKGYIQLCLYGYSGHVSFDFWGYSTKKKSKAIKELNNLIALVKTMIDDIEDMECNDDE